MRLLNIIIFAFIIIIINPDSGIRAEDNWIANRAVGNITDKAGKEMYVNSNGVPLTKSEAIKENLTIISRDSSGGIKYVPVGSNDVTDYPPVASQVVPETVSSSATFSYRTPDWYTPTSGNPLLIKKALATAKSQDRYVLGDEILVYVEITNTKKELENILIREIIDDDLQLITPTGYCTPIGAVRTNDIDKISKQEQEFFKSQSGYIPYKDSTKIFKSYLAKDNIYPVFINSSSFLFNWSYQCKNNSCKFDDATEKNRIKDFLRYGYDIDWINDTEINCANELNTSFIYINGSHSNDRITFKVQDIGRIANNIEEKVLMNISDERSYTFSINESNGVLKVWDRNNILGFNLDKLSKREKVIYWYYVIPKRSGIFNVETLARVYDENYPNSPDISNPKEIIVKTPDLEFEVKPGLNKYNIYQDGWSGIFKEDLNLVYDITFVGDAPDKFIDNIDIKLDKTKMDDIEFNGTSSSLDFSVNRTQRISERAKYPKTGIYRVPSLWIDGKYYAVESQGITVDTPLERHRDILSLFIAAIALVFGLIFNKEIKKEVGKLRRSKGKKEPNHETQAQMDQEEFFDKITVLMKAGAFSTQYNSAMSEIAELKRELKDLKREIHENK